MTKLRHQDQGKSSSYKPCLYNIFSEIFPILATTIIRNPNAEVHRSVGVWTDRSVYILSMHAALARTQKGSSVLSSSVTAACERPGSVRSSPLNRAVRAWWNGSEPRMCCAQPFFDHGRPVCSLRTIDGHPGWLVVHLSFDSCLPVPLSLTSAALPTSIPTTCVSSV
jgi:hypothetical protein